MDRETELKEALRFINELARQAAKPIIDELIKLESLKPPAPIVMSVEAFEKFQDANPISSMIDIARGHVAVAKAKDDAGLNIMPGDLRIAPEGAKPVIMEPSHYVLPRGTNSMVKTADYFNEQLPTWGNDGWKSWKPVYVEIGDDPGLGIEAARELAAHMEPIDGRWTTLSPRLPDELALRPHNALYRECRGKWRSPIA